MLWWELLTDRVVLVGDELSWACEVALGCREVADVPRDKASSVGMWTFRGAEVPVIEVPPAALLRECRLALAWRLGVMLAPPCGRGTGMAEAGRTRRRLLGCSISSVSLSDCALLPIWEYGEPGDGDGKWNPGENVRGRGPEALRDVEPSPLGKPSGEPPNRSGDVTEGVELMEEATDLAGEDVRTPFVNISGRATPGLLGESTAYDVLLDVRRIINGAVILFLLLLELECTDVFDGNRVGDAIVPLDDRRFAGSGGNGGMGSSLSGCTRPAPTEVLRFRRPGDLSGDESFELDPPDDRRFQNEGRFSRRLSVEGAGLMLCAGGVKDENSRFVASEADATGVPFDGDG